MKNAKAQKRGRKPILSNILNKKILLFPNRTTKEITDLIFDEIRPSLKGGVNGDATKQKLSLVVGVHNFRAAKLKEGKKVAFRGREVVDCKGNKVHKTSYVRVKQAAK